MQRIGGGSHCFSATLVGCFPPRVWRHSRVHALSNFDPRNLSIGLKGKYVKVHNCRSDTAEESWDRLALAIAKARKAV
jgi:hypothetical protein